LMVDLRATRRRGTERSSLRLWPSRDGSGRRHCLGDPYNAEPKTPPCAAR
jgi:hypothetical protein